jgi:hypothetical protein
MKGAGEWRLRRTGAAGVRLRPPRGGRGGASGGRTATPVSAQRGMDAERSRAQLGTMPSGAVPPPGGRGGAVLGSVGDAGRQTRFPLHGLGRGGADTPRRRRA